MGQTGGGGALCLRIFDLGVCSQAIDGGLDLGVQSVLGGTTAWFCEYDKAPSAILAHHWSDVPNLGDITAVDWAHVEPVDVITGGFPCTDVSHAGRRAGLIRDGEGRTRSGLWGHMLRAVDELRPRLVVAENVRGLLSAKADSDVEPCPLCMGDAGPSPLRALGAVLADLADVGYDAWWIGLRAADVGAAHGRFRVFIFATPADADDRLHGILSGGLAGSTASGERGHTGTGGGPSDRDRGVTDGDLTLLPTPAVLAIEAQRLLPTPRATDGTKGGPDQRGSSGDLMLPSAVHQNWGDYAAAIARWESVLGRPAPAPPEPGKTGNPRLSPVFVEFLMGLPAGHVTGVPGLTRSDQLKVLGNGVVWQQCAAATRWFLDQKRITKETA